MSYPRDLDEYTDEELQEELTRRAALRERGLCDYCGKNANAPICRFMRRHPKRPHRKKPAPDEGSMTSDPS